MKFEYKCLEYDNDSLFDRGVERELNNLGSLGWELVSAVPIKIGSEERANKKEIHFFFKRPLD